MATYSNAQILAAVLNKWAAPIVNSLVERNIGIIPILANIEAKLRSTGWVSPNWSLSRELSPIMSNVTSIVIEPIIAQYISGIPDASIPKVAHTLVDNAIKNGNLQLMEGNISFDVKDLIELKRYLDFNLPLKDADGYEVIIE